MSDKTSVNMNTFNRDELELLREWFNSVQDLSHPDYLKPKDYQLAKKIYTVLGKRVPESVDLKTG